MSDIWRKAAELVAQISGEDTKRKDFIITPEYAAARESYYKAEQIKEELAKKNWHRDFSQKPVFKRHLLMYNKSCERR